MAVRQVADEPSSARPIMFELQPHLTGSLLDLRPLQGGDWESLFRAASDPLIWEVHPVSDRWKEEVFRQYFREGLESGGAFAVVDRKTGEIVGSSRYSNLKADESEIEIGSTFLARSHWGGVYNGEMKRLMLDHAFRFVDTVVFRIGFDNLRSRRAIEKIGGVLTDRREFVNLHDRIIEHVVYAIARPADKTPPADSHSPPR
jgi:RimJ/RimL family protein N-acetyltransferase